MQLVNSPNRHLMWYIHSILVLEKTVAMKWNDFSPFTLKTSLVFLTPELFPCSVLNPTAAAMTPTLLLRSHRELLTQSSAIKGGGNYYGIRQGYCYSSLEVKSLGSRWMVFSWPWKQVHARTAWLLMTPVRVKLMNPNHQINRGINRCVLAGLPVLQQKQQKEQANNSNRYSSFIIHTSLELNIFSSNTEAHTRSSTKEPY